MIAGGGELVGYLLRLVSGRIAQRTGAYWPLAIGGYALTMASVPAMAFVFNWQTAALFVLLERAGKATRSPATNTMQSRAGDHIGQGWAFGLQEALDQTGAIIGPLITAFVLARHGDYRAAYAWLAVPAALTMLSVAIIAVRYSYAGHIVQPPQGEDAAGPVARLLALHRKRGAAWLRLCGLFADRLSLRAGVGRFEGVHSRLLRRCDGRVRRGRAACSAAVRPARPGRACSRDPARRGRHTRSSFWATASAALAGTILWGMTMGTQNALMSASIAKIVPEKMRARAYGLFSAIYGTAWFVGSALLGMLYDYSFVALAVVAVIAQLLSIVPLLATVRALRR